MHSKVSKFSILPMAQRDKFSRMIDWADVDDLDPRNELQRSCNEPSTPSLVLLETYLVPFVHATPFRLLTYLPPPSPHSRMK